MTKKFVIFIFSLTLAIGLVSARPLVINADSISSSNVIGVEPKILDYNVSVNPQSQTINGTTYAAVDYVLEFVVNLDSCYYGEITGDLLFYWDSYILTNNTATPVRNNTEINDKTYSVNGNSFFISYELRAIKTVNTSHEDLFDPYYDITFTIDSSDVENYGVLGDLYSWNFPINSYGFVSKYYTDSSKTYIDIFDNGYWTYPLFSTSNDFVYQFTNNKTYELVLGINRNVYGISTFNQIFSLTNATINSCYYVQQGKYHNDDFYIFHAQITRTGSNSFLRLKDYSGVVLMPVYCDYSDKNNFTSDFALVFGFSNQPLDDLHIIAQGNQQSNSSSSDLEDSAQEYGELADDVLGLEDDLGSGFSSSLNNVPTTFNFSTQFGNKFLHSATWVRTQFETLTTDTPFGALITFSLVLGLALLLVGRRLL